MFCHEVSVKHFFEVNAYDLSLRDERPMEMNSVEV